MKIAFKGNPLTLVGRQLTVAPDYTVALNALADVVKNPGVLSTVSTGCLPCKVAAALAQEKISSLAAQIPLWKVLDNKLLIREFTFKDFGAAHWFSQAVAGLAYSQGHHPYIGLGWGKVTVTLTTHAAHGLSDNDFAMANMIDQISA